jgi:hypothetical protein
MNHQVIGDNVMLNIAQFKLSPTTKRFKRIWNLTYGDNDQSEVLELYRLELKDSISIGYLLNIKEKNSLLCNIGIDYFLNQNNVLKLKDTSVIEKYRDIEFESYDDEFRSFNKKSSIFQKDIKDEQMQMIIFFRNIDSFFKVFKYDRNNISKLFQDYNLCKYTMLVNNILKQRCQEIFDKYVPIERSFIQNTQFEKNIISYAEAKKVWTKEFC